MTEQATRLEQRAARVEETSAEYDEAVAGLTALLAEESAAKAAWIDAQAKLMRALTVETLATTHTYALQQRARLGIAPDGEALDEIEREAPLLAAERVEAADWVRELRHTVRETALAQERLAVQVNTQHQRVRVTEQVHSDAVSDLSWARLGEVSDVFADDDLEFEIMDIGMIDSAGQNTEVDDDCVVHGVPLTDGFCDACHVEFDDD